MTTTMNPITGAHKQTLGLVLLAELRRSLAPGGLLIASIVSMGIGALSGSLTVWLIAANSGDLDGPDPAVDYAPLVVCVFMTALAFSVGLIGLTSREMADGTVTGSAILVPSRPRLLVARSLTTMILAVGVSVAPLIFVALIRLTAGGITDDTLTHMGRVIVVALVDMVLAMLLAFLVATLLRKPAIAVTVFLLALIVLPLVLAIATLITPPFLADPSRFALRAMPGQLFQRALSVPVEPGDSWRNVIIGLGGLFAWVVAVTPVTWALFGKAIANKD